MFYLLETPCTLFNINCYFFGNNRTFNFNTLLNSKFKVSIKSVCDISEGENVAVNVAITTKKPKSTTLCNTTERIQYKKRELIIS